MAKKPTTAVVDWKAQMAAEAKIAKEMEKSTGGGKSFKMRAGVLSFDDTPLPGNQLACVIVDSVYENLFYEEKFDPDAMTPPSCFALGRDEDTMGPDEEHMDKYPDAFNAQSPTCADCPNNEWGSADKGKGKACGNRRRLAIIPAGTFNKVKGGAFELDMFDDPDVFKSAEIAFMKLPVTSVKNYSSYVRSLADELERPPYGVFTRIYLEPDAKSQFKVHFELLDEIPDEIMPVIMARNTEAKESIMFKYTPMEDDDKPEQKPQRQAARKKLTGKAPAKGRQSKR